MYLPAGFANMVPPLFKKVDFLNYPIDFKKKINGKRILGDNKTVRGFVFGIIISVLITFIIDYSLNIKIYTNNVLGDLFLGGLIGFFALFFDSIESFFKRQKNIEPGESFIPFDQTDWVFGSSLLLYSIGKINIVEFLEALIIFFFIHVLVKHTSYYLGIENKKW